MHGISLLIVILEGAAFVIALVIIIFLIARRVRIKKEEDFENRSN